MAKVDVTVELYYSGAWHDITATDDVYSRDPIVITRGRPDEVQRIPPSTLSLTINNRGGVYSPRNPNSALYGLIGRNTPIRVSVGTSVRFVGEVESWPQRWSVGGHDVWIPLTANGIMRRLNAPGTTHPARSALLRAIVASAATLTLAAYWALNGGQLSTVGSLTLGSGGSFAPLSGATKFGEGPISPWLESGVTMSENATMSAAVTGMSTAPTQMTFDHVRRGDAGGSGPSVIDLRGNTLAGGNQWIITLTPGFNDIEVQLNHNGTFVDLTGPTVVAGLFDNDSHHIRFDAVQNGGNIDWAIYVDAVSVLSDTYAGTLTGVGEVRLSYNPGSGGTSMALGHVATWQDGPLDSAYSASVGWRGETAGRRIERLCDEDGVTFTSSGDLDATALMGAQAPDNLLNLISEAADVDQGILFEPRDSLGLTYRTHNTLYNQAPALALTYGQAGEVAPPLDPVEDTDATVNDVTVTRRDGGSAAAVRETGPLNVAEPGAATGAVGRYSKDYTLLLYEDGQCPDAASWLRHLGTWDEARYPVVNLDLTAMGVENKTALAADAVALDVGDRFTIAEPPAWLPPDTIVQHAQGFVETIESHRHTIAVNATPALPYEVFVVETGSDNRSRIPPAVGSTAAEALTTTETLIDIVSTRVPWIDSATYPAQFPYDIMIGGEVIRVKSCSGTGLSQTLTTTRSINGVVKSHLIGQAVQLFHPPVLAL